MQENLEWIASVAAMALPLIAAILTCLIKLVKSLKFGKEERKKRLWTEFAQESIACVEALKGKANGELAGSTKKEIVMSKVEAACIKNNVKFDAVQVSELIENIIHLTKVVNGREKDKTEQMYSNVLPLVNK